MSYNSYQHPDITRALETGYPGEDITPVCPKCGWECDTVYTDGTTGDILGCNNCVDAMDAREALCE